ncbi:unnamed protein product, partial [Allacma fusca]
MENSSIPDVGEDFEDEYIFEDPRLQAVLILLYSIVFFFCFFGNFTIMIVMALHWKMRGSTKFCLGNLAFANLCVGIFCVYQDLSMYLIDSWVFGEFLCKMYHFTNNLAHAASILILVVIAIERYFAILHPFICRRVFTMRRLRLVILGVWILSALLSSPRLYYVVTVTNSFPTRKGEPMRDEVICTLHLSIYDSSTAAVIQFILLFLSPLIIISLLYAKIGLFLRQRETFVCSFVQGSGGAAESESSSGERISLRDSTRNSMFESFHRKVSFKKEAQRERVQEKTEHCEHSEHKSNSNSKSACPLCPITTPKRTPGSGKIRRDSSRRGALKRQGSNSSVSSSSVAHQTRLTRNSSQNGAPGTAVQNPHKGV